MASINGYCLKSLKTCEGNLGIGFEGKLYKKSKFIGYASEPGDGEAMSLDINGDTYGDKVKIIENVARNVGEYFKAKQTSDISMLYEHVIKSVNNNEHLEVFIALINELVDLSAEEKMFKKAIKDGYAGVALFTNANGVDKNLQLQKKWLSKGVDSIKFMTEDIRSRGGKNVRLYTSLEQFDIVK